MAKTPKNAPKKSKNNQQPTHGKKSQTSKKSTSPNKAKMIAAGAAYTGRAKPFCALEDYSMAKLRRQLDTLMPARSESFDVIYKLSNHLLALKDPKSWNTESGMMLLTAINVATYHHAEAAAVCSVNAPPPDYTQHGDNIVSANTYFQSDGDDVEYAEPDLTEEFVQDIVEAELDQREASTPLAVVRAACHQMNLLHEGELKKSVGAAIGKTWLKFLENLPLDPDMPCAGEDAQYFIPTHVEMLSLAGLAQQMETTAMKYVNYAYGMLSRDVMAVQLTETLNVVMTQLMLEVARQCKNFPRKIAREIEEEYRELPHETAQHLKEHNDLSFGVIQGGITDN